ncbi:hypothetical protein, conserved [Babesia ovata]|uniref:C3H1-type domain-containing protein n=1 Tax=Babesia ovata TaxID=189622 RepID=A0A2H6KKJ2_9APIC|nr:uncharacterized protein BOVATA_050080 [Babesia ovata]GBE63515.1 hypothetical protein, conserved [Babesia ovata]
MDKILQEIQASMHQKGALGTWDGEVTGKTERVKDYFNNINAVTIKHFNTSLSELSGCGPGEVADKLGNCFIHADAILNAFKLAESYYSDLDPKLGDKLKDSIYKIHVQVAKFHGAATNTELRNLLDCSARQLNAISEFVAKRAAQRLSELQAYLRDEIGVVESNLDGLRSNKFKELQNALYQDLHKAFKEVEGGITSVISKYDNKIFQPVGIIKSASDSFKTEINETRISLQEAIQVVEGEIRKLENFRDLESIGASLKGTVQLLSAINSDPFDRVKKYFTSLETGVMTPLKKAMDKIGECMNKVFRPDGMYDFQWVLSDAKNSINELKTAIGSQGKVPEISDIETLHGMKIGSENLNLRETLSKHSNAINAVIQKLELSSGKLITKADIMSLLIDLGSIAQEVSKHSKEVVENVMGAIQEKVSQEVRDVAGTINARVTECSNLVGTIGGTFHIRSGVKKVTGLEKLVETFNRAIDGELERLKEHHVGKSTDTKKKGSKESVYAELNDLKSKIEALACKADDVRKCVLAVRTELFLCIRDASKLHDEAPKRTANIIKELTTEVNAKIAASTTNIEMTAKNEYHSRISEAFSNLTTVAFYGTEEIRQIINKDLNTGLKGFLKTLSGVCIDANAAGFDNKNVFVQSQNNNYLTDLQNSGTQGLHGDKVADVSAKSLAYLNHIHTYVSHDLPKHLPSSSQYPSQLSTIHSAVDTLLSHLSTQKHFDHKVPGMLAELKTSVQALHSTNFGNPAYPVLDAFPKSLVRFVEQLERGYVNRYEGGEDAEEFKKFVNDYPKNDELISYGTNLSKVLLTLMEGLRKDVFDLQNECKPDGKNKWREKSIYLYENGQKKRNPLGDWLKRRGFQVPSKMDKQDGELQNTKEMNGEQIHTMHLTNKYIDVTKIPILKIWKQEKDKKNNIPSTATNGDVQIPLTDFVDFLREIFRKYYQVRQHEHIPSPKSPSNVFQMLCWLSGLRFNPMFAKLGEHFKELFDKPEGKKDLPYSEINEDELSLPATSLINPKVLQDKLEQVCLHSQLVSVAILGNGHADGRYACDFRTNPDKLLYPSNPSACFDMLADVLNRVFYQLRFLYSQCSNSRSRGGWEECSYGRYVGGSSWDCNDKQCANLECPHIANLTATRKATRTATRNTNLNCDQHPNCGVKSSLQSFLEDGLQGFLPHSFTTPGCKLTCTLSNHTGIPCLTPMGFTEIGIAASHTKKGAHLKDALFHLCGSDCHLDKLCSYLKCLLRVAPQTLGDMLAFYYQFLKHFGASDHKQKAFEEAVQKANFKNPETNLDVTPMFGSSAHSEKHYKGDLFSLTDCNHKINPGLPCGKYLHPITLNIRSIFSEKRADNYLSWVTYITETFVALLQKLYESCKKCETPGTRCCDKSCAEKCQVKYTNEKGDAITPTAGTKHNEKCKSIVKCPDTHPTLYKYGFTFTSPSGLSGEEKEAKYKRTCKDFCHALKKSLEEESVLIKLIKDIDDFIWMIRQKFSYLLLALWSLSLLYLLHITVVRIDVLRIRSHLRSPSSHRIAAQSLLAAARVKALANVKYFSP